MPKPSLPLPTLTSTQIAKFWSKVRRREPDECWLWTAGCNKQGYGVFHATHMSSQRAHRVAHSLASGRDPHPLLVLHSCDNPPCCNPAHLRTGTAADNNKDCAAKGRTACGDRSGSRLHPESRPRGAAHGSRTHPERVARGERQGSAKLTTIDVVAIRQRAAKGETGAVLGREYQVGNSTIYDIIRRRIWKHV